MTEKKINYQFKLLYALGIIFIVAGHCKDGGVSLFYDWFTPYSFHLALFVFCSGYFYNKNNEQAICKSILHKVKTLLLPLYLWNLFYSVLVMVLRHFDFTIGEPFSWYNLLIAPWTDGHQYEFNMGGWFVTPLFVVYVLNLLFRKVLSLVKLDNDYLVCALYILFGMYGIHLAMQGQNEGFYLMVVRVAYFIPFYGMGMLYRHHLEKRDNIPNVIYFGIILLAQLLIISYYGETKSYIPSWGQTYDSIYMPFVLGLLGILFWLRVTRILAPLCEKSKLVLLLANNTYSIMVNHFLGFFVVNTMFYLAFTRLQMCNGFESFLYHTNIWYFYLPRNMTQWYVVYLIVGLALPIAMSAVVQQVKKLFCRLLPKTK